MIRYQDLKRMKEQESCKEQEEALVRSQTMLMLDRNQGKAHIIERVLKRFLGCIKH